MRRRPRRRPTAPIRPSPNRPREGTIDAAALGTALTARLERLGRLHPKRIDLSLGRIERVLSVLGRPQDRLPPVVHVAGTNGKGSTCAYLRAIGEASGRRVHVYTSPHLVRFTERIVLAGREIAPDALIDLLDRIEEANDGAEITFFEVTTAAALLAFAETPADLLVLEVGLGGRFDATNVIAAPAVAAITPIGFDHMEYLGDTLTKIAGEKAGIFKPGAPVVIGRQEPEARAALVACAHETGVSSLAVWGRDFEARAEHGRLVYEAEGRLLDLPAPALLGPHQVQNAGLAIAAALTIGLDDDDAIGRGIAGARWPARLERISAGPLAEAVGCEDGAELWLDGAHNVPAAQALAAALADLDDRNPKPLVLILGMLATKDARRFLEVFAGLARRIVTVPVSASQAGVPPHDLASLAARSGHAAVVADDLEDACAKAHWTELGEPARVVICGSLYLAGEALAITRGEAGPDVTRG